MPDEFPPGWFDERTYIADGVESRATRQGDVAGFLVKIGDESFFIEEKQARKLARHWMFPQDYRN
jgi:hypothetical protein